MATLRLEHARGTHKIFFANGLEISSPAEAGAHRLIFAPAWRQGAPTYPPPSRVSLREFLGGARATPLRRASLVP